jgi:hypothetical protein
MENQGVMRSFNPVNRSRFSAFITVALRENVELFVPMDSLPVSSFIFHSGFRRNKPRFAGDDGCGSEQDITNNKEPLVALWCYCAIAL